MICAVCHQMLRGHSGQEWRGSYDLCFIHHKTENDLQLSAKMGCCFCRVIWSAVEQLDRALREKGKNKEKENDKENGDSRSSRLSSFTRASLANVRGWDGVYRLDFKLAGVYERPVGTFVLRESEILKTPIRTPVDLTTDSDEVFHLAKKWISVCHESHTRCHSREPDWIPKRLIDLKSVNPAGAEEVRWVSPEDWNSVGRKKARRVKTVPLDFAGEKKMRRVNTEPWNYVGDKKVRLVETENWKPDDPKPKYTTLSHRWGGSKFLRLEPENFLKLQEGVKLDKLPATFRHAMQVTQRLGIRYIWIDALCIIQAGPNARDDWLSESAQMDKIYGNSYCNISATAAENSDEGLFFQREPEDLWEHDIYLSPKRFLGEADSNVTRRCTVIDPTFWEREVDRAPVNTRGWVLQEKLIAPRVLHFCRNQIAWECSVLQAAECHPDGLPNFQLVSSNIVQRRTLKGLDSGKDGKRLREARISSPLNATNQYLLASSSQLSIIYEGSEPRLSVVDPDRHLIPEIYAHELWKHIVEAYSKMHLTKKEDKLIALSGIAKVMSREIDDEYIAGMWREYLPSHLLWYVNENYEDGRFSYTSTRPSGYRAPTFSWASLDTPSGITYGETTDRDLFIDVRDVKLDFENRGDKFGLVRSGYLTLKYVTRKQVQIVKIKGNGTTRYGWRLMSPRGSRVFSNIYLDSPISDTYIFDDESQVFCLPAACGDRRESAKYLICLLVALDEGQGSRYKRVGLLKVAPYDRGIQRILLSEKEEGRDDPTRRRAPIKWEEYLSAPKRNEMLVI